MRFAIPIVFSVRLIVLLVVRNELGEGETVVCRHEVDRGDRPPARVLVEVFGACDTRGEFAEGRWLAPPEVPHRTVVLTVPLCPLRREVAHLIAPWADIPWLGDELHL